MNTTVKNVHLKMKYKQVWNF